jgi:hypothetical protein
VGAGLYPALLVRGDTLHAAYTASQGREKIYCLRSGDRGEGWDAARLLNDTLGYNEAYFPRILAHGPRLMALWSEMQRQGPQLWYISYAVSSDGGRSWGPPRHALDPGLPDVYLFAAAAADSTVNVIYSRAVWPQLGFYLIRSTDFGGTWSAPIRLFWAEESTLSDMEAWGYTCHFVWSGSFAEGVNWEVYYIKSADRGLTWSAAETLTAPGDRGARHPALAINESGKMALAWTDFRFAPPGWNADIFVARSTDQGVSWVGEAQVTFLHQDGYSDISYHGDSLDVVFERGIASGCIYHLRSVDDGQSWGQETELDHDPADSHSPKIGAAGGKTYAVWADDRENPDTSIAGGPYFSYYPHEPVAAIDNGKVPLAFALAASPNPFNAATTITVQGGGEAEIAIYDIVGRRVATLNVTNGRAVWEARG